MQILFFVFSFLLALGFVTHSELGRFREMQVSRIAFNRYLHARDEQVLNEAQLKVYESKKAGPRGENEGLIRLNPKINVFPFLGEKSRQADRHFMRRREILMNLIRELYSSEALYEQMSRDYSDLEGYLLDQVMAAADRQREAVGFRSPEQLAELQLENPDMQLLWYRLLKGTQDPLISQAGYPALSHFLDIQPKRTLGISVYKAPKIILVAIFGRSPLVDEIIRKREELYQDLRKGRMDKAEASRIFGSLFSGGPLEGTERGLLDFRVNTTRP